MKKLELPQIKPIDVYMECLESIKNPILKCKFQKNQTHIELSINDYNNACDTRSWCDLPRVPNGSSGRIIAGNLSKKELVNLYSTYMVKSKEEARNIYDELLVAANGKCPFCGGIGHATTLDHYLPKANFPIFSVNPVNLIPCCKDCNHAKSNSFTNIVSDQSIHPYIDHAHLFDERWLFTNIQNTDPIGLEFYANPPANWDLVDKQRVTKHFEEYNFDLRYSTEAASELASLIYLRQRTLRNSSEEGFRNYLFDNADDRNLPMNGWKRTLYAALSESDWFCQTVF